MKKLHMLMMIGSAVVAVGAVFHAEGGEFCTHFRPNSKNCLYKTGETAVVEVSFADNTWNWILDFIYMDFASARSGEWSWTSHVVKDHVTSDHAPVVADITCQRIKKREKARAWVDEEAHTAGLTGTWSGDVVYDWQTFTAPLAGQYVFTPDNPSRGSRVTVDVTATFSDIPEVEIGSCTASVSTVTTIS